MYDILHISLKAFAVNINLRLVRSKMNKRILPPEKKDAIFRVQHLNFPLKIV